VIINYRQARRNKNEDVETRCRWRRDRE